MSIMSKSVLSALAITAATLGTCPALAADECPPLKVMASVDMVPAKDGRMMAPVTVAGQPEYFIVSTSNPLSSIAPALADQLKLVREHSRVTFVGMNGQRDNKLVIVPTFQLGGLRADSAQFILGDRTGGMPPPGSQEPLGMLGSEFLRGYDVDLDFGANKLNLISQDHCGGDVLYWKSDRVAKLPMVVLDNDKITFPMTLDGHELQAVLSTGLAMSAINMDTAEEIYDVDNGSVDNKKIGRLDSDTPLYAHRFKMLSVAGLEIANPELVLMPDRVRESIRNHQPFRSNRQLVTPASEKIPQLMLGIAELRHLHVYIDYHNQAIYFSPATKGGDFPKAAAGTAARP